MIVIGLTGYAGSGKDEAAKALIERRGFVRVSFADPVRDALLALNPVVDSTGWRVADYVERYGWTIAKTVCPEIRILLQRMGTEVGRQQFGQNFWSDIAANKIDSLPENVPIVITDVRFQNEVDVIKKFRGSMIRIARESVKPVNDHISDTGIDALPVHVVLHNNRTIEDLHELILGTVDTILTQPTKFVTPFQPALYPPEMSCRV